MFKGRAVDVDRDKYYIAPFFVNNNSIAEIVYNPLKYDDVIEISKEELRQVYDVLYGIIRENK